MSEFAIEGVDAIGYLASILVVTFCERTMIALNSVMRYAVP
jgi:hypothetical protein